MEPIARTPSCDRYEIVRSACIGARRLGARNEVVLARAEVGSAVSMPREVVMTTRR